MLKRVIGRLAGTLSVKIITWNGNHSDRTTYTGIALMGRFPLAIGEGFYEKGRNLGDLPRLNQEGGVILLSQTSYSLNSLQENYMGKYIGEHYGGYEGGYSESRQWLILNHWQHISNPLIGL